jgi:hypothetical protein
MRKAALLAGLAVALMVGLAGPVGAQSGPEMLGQGRQLFGEARFQEAQQELRAAIGRLDLSPAQRAQAWAYLGFCFLGMGHPEMALESMLSARAADPAYAPDLARLSPKARELWELSNPNRPPREAQSAPAASPPPPQSGAPQAPAPAPAPGADIRETPLAEPAPRLHGLELAYDVRDGRPVGVTKVFAPTAKRIVLWAAMENVAPDTPLRAVWTFQGDPPVQIVDTGMPAPAGASWVEFSCQLATGKTWPAGRYQVELFLDQDSAGSLEFEVP